MISTRHNLIDKSRSRGSRRWRSRGVQGKTAGWWGGSGCPPNEQHTCSDVLGCWRWIGRERINTYTSVLAQRRRPCFGCSKPQTMTFLERWLERWCTSNVSFCCSDGRNERTFEQPPEEKRSVLDAKKKHGRVRPAITREEGWVAANDRFYGDNL